MVTEERISRLEGAYEQVDRLLDELSQSLNALRSEIKSHINNLYLLLFGSWATIIAAIIGL